VQEDEAMAPELMTRPQAAEGPATPGGGDQILIVDDNPIDRHIARSIVRSIPGLASVEAADGEEALLAVAERRPALILTDLQMPGLDGFGLVEALRETAPEIPVILMTAHGSEEIAIRALQAGAASYVPKRMLARDLPRTLPQILALASSGLKRRELLGSMWARALAFRLENDPSLVAPLIELLQDDLAAMGLCDRTARTRVGVSLHEAITNALYHGNLEVSSDLRQEDERFFQIEAERRRALEPYRSRRIHVEARLDRESATYVIRDEGPGFDTSRIDRPIEPEDLMRVGGRGLLLIRMFMNEVLFNPSGNQITLTWRAADSEA
jgi:CheY-like chemotaxis protein